MPKQQARQRTHRSEVEVEGLNEKFHEANNVLMLERHKKDAWKKLCIDFNNSFRRSIIDHALLNKTLAAYQKLLKEDR